MLRRPFPGRDRASGKIGDLKLYGDTVDEVETPRTSLRVASFLRLRVGDVGKSDRARWDDFNE
jgi:hypothetical protein